MKLVSKNVFRAVLTDTKCRTHYLVGYKNSFHFLSGPNRSISCVSGDTSSELMKSFNLQIILVRKM